MSYIIVTASDDKTSEQRCKEIAEALWTLQRPRSVRGSSDVTSSFCSVVKHSDGRAALRIASSDLIKPHADLDTAELFDSITEYTTQKKTAVTTKLGDNHGVKIDVGDILPTSFTYTTQSAMESDGWFPDAD
jgi:hypothetical protein